jgi:uncharacterized membrane protein
MPDKKETARIETFSDGVFAIAITLLVLEIKVPPIDRIHSAGDLWHELANLWPSYFAFTFSFGTLIVAWVNHHRVFDLLGKSSQAFMYANGFLLLTVTFLPFPTAVLAEYIATDYAGPAIIFYCANGVLSSLGWMLMFTEAQKLIRADVPHSLLRRYKRSMPTGFLVYVATTILAIWLPIVALLINVSVWLLWIAMSLWGSEQ